MKAVSTPSTGPRADTKPSQGSHSRSPPKGGGGVVLCRGLGPEWSRAPPGGNNRHRGASVAGSRDPVQRRRANITTLCFTRLWLHLEPMSHQYLRLCAPWHTKGRRAPGAEGARTFPRDEGTRKEYPATPLFPSFFLFSPSSFLLLFSFSSLDSFPRALPSCQQQSQHASGNETRRHVPLSSPRDETEVDSLFSTTCCRPQ